MVKWTDFNTEWGTAGIAWTDKGVCMLVRPGPGRDRIKSEVLEEFPQAAKGGPAEVGEVIRQVRDYFAGELTGFKARLDLSRASPFQRMIYDTLMKIPYAETWSYARVASEAGRPGAARAVGRANSMNPVPVIVPCHRVIKADGSLGGFSQGGPEAKEALIEHEVKVLTASARGGTVAG